ncbi:ribosome silencing factor [Staphylococcus debuckii]|uniref:Ribosomal silencing factor RsfS n=1 Tax=Staphylococcus debuckii TaxID=2044912 RepID=A0ABU9EZB2_9STAP|nr:ribosome silencing factor [Staphylococcus debuckii]AYU55380.1 ribosome silencing factor [Staphylococcus debuckii]
MQKTEILNMAVKAVESKRAEEVISLDLEGINDMADYFVICHGNNERQVQAIARAVKEAADKAGIDISVFEGLNEARWVLLDLSGVIVHIFHKDERSYYNIEKLYRDAPMQTYEEAY